ncbi:hypothetical protein WMF18_16110 [Sorangium sp. So ce315]|uniref:hypothetical protein n=1 Tax=unclassified Sorangium TaxID=2621164 RepID=UPI003F618D63
MRAHKLFAAFAVMIASPALLIAACKSSDDPAEVAPAPADVTAPTATATETAPLPAATGTVPAATPTPAAPPATAKAPPAQPAAAGAKADAGAGAGAATDGGAPTDAGAPPTPDAGALSGKLAACAAKCQSILQTCLTPKFPADGGMPRIENPTACQESFDACRTACAP